MASTDIQVPTANYLKRKIWHDVSDEPLIKCIRANGDREEIFFEDREPVTSDNESCNIRDLPKNINCESDASEKSQDSEDCGESEGSLKSYVSDDLYKGSAEDQEFQDWQKNTAYHPWDAEVPETNVTPYLYSEDAEDFTDQALYDWDKNSGYNPCTIQPYLPEYVARDAQQLPDYNDEDFWKDDVEAAVNKFDQAYSAHFETFPFEYDDYNNEVQRLDQVIEEVKGEISKLHDALDLQNNKYNNMNSNILCSTRVDVSEEDTEWDDIIDVICEQLKNIVRITTV